MTTNLGAKETLGFSGKDKSYEEKLKAAIDKHFTPEFLNRIDRTVYFAPLSEDTLVAIFDREFAPFQERLRVEKEIEVTVAEHVKRQVAQQAATQLRGARPLRRLIEDQIVAPIVDKLLPGDYKPGTHITIDQELQLPDQKIEPEVEQPKPPFDPGQIKFDPANLDLGGSGQPKPPPPKPKRPTTPEEGLPQLDNVDDEYQEAFDKHFLELAKNLLETRGITLEITDFAKNYLCAPYNQTLREERSPEQAFEDLIKPPLTDKILAEDFQDGDWIRIDRKFEEIVFEKMEEE